MAHLLGLAAAGHRGLLCIDAHAWTPIEYTNAVRDDAQGWISSAEVAEIDYTAFTSKPKDKQITARLIVRRVRPQPRQPE